MWDSLIVIYWYVLAIFSCFFVTATLFSPTCNFSVIIRWVATHSRQSDVSKRGREKKYWLQIRKRKGRGGGLCSHALGGTNAQNAPPPGGALHRVDYMLGAHQAISIHFSFFNLAWMEMEDIFQYCCLCWKLECSHLTRYIVLNLMIYRPIVWLDIYI